MSTPISSELLSAYLDGECSPSERAHVEEQLCENADLRAHLDELRDISSCLQGLPCAPAPGDLRDSILQQVNTSSVAAACLLPRADFEVLMDRRSRLWRWRGAMLAVAVVVVCLVALLPRPMQHAGRELAVRGEASRTVAPGAEHELSDEATRRGGSVEIASAPAGAMIAGMAMSSSDVDNPTADESNGELVRVVELNRDQLRAKLAELTQPLERGSHFHYFDGADRETPVLVDMTVVDVIHAYDHVQLLLKQQHVASRPAGEIAIDRSAEAESMKAASTTENSKPAPQLVSLYFEVEPDVAIQVLNGLPALDAVVYVDESRTRIERATTDSALSENSPTVTGRAAQLNARSAEPQLNANSQQSTFPPALVANSRQLNFSNLTQQAPRQQQMQRNGQLGAEDALLADPNFKRNDQLFLSPSEQQLQLLRALPADEPARAVAGQRVELAPAAPQSGPALVPASEADQRRDAATSGGAAAASSQSKFGTVLLLRGSTPTEHPIRDESDRRASPQGRR